MVRKKYFGKTCKTNRLSAENQSNLEDHILLEWIVFLLKLVGNSRVSHMVDNPSVDINSIDFSVDTGMFSFSTALKLFAY